ncbi:hypothetical protein VDN17_002951 [Listeria monocytogenes]|nr:hypothetical protein [Listeria monocytogenes]EMC3833904.1 hypothetical protein [Listeria monocytogenes]
MKKNIEVKNLDQLTAEVIHRKGNAAYLFEIEFEVNAINYSLFRLANLIEEGTIISELSARVSEVIYVFDIKSIKPGKIEFMFRNSSIYVGKQKLKGW